MIRECVKKIIHHSTTSVFPYSSTTIFYGFFCYIWKWGVLYMYCSSVMVGWRQQVLRKTHNTRVQTSIITQASNTILFLGWGMMSLVVSIILNCNYCNNLLNYIYLLFKGVMLINDDIATANYKLLHSCNSRVGI